MKALLLDTKKKEVRVVNPHGLFDYYELLDCHLIEHATRKIGGKKFDIICDEEGTFVDDPLISAIDDFGRTMLVGNLLICGLPDGEGESSDLTDDDIEYIRRRIQPMDTRLHRDLLMLTQCNYC